MVNICSSVGIVCVCASLCGGVCLYMVYCWRAAINAACLVYDGRLVIDASFHTNDPSIRAAGTVTKYQRRYYTELTHADFNSKEIGVQVITVLLALLSSCDADCSMPSHLFCAFAAVTLLLVVSMQPGGSVLVGYAGVQ